MYNKRYSSLSLFSNAVFQGTISEFRSRRHTILIDVERHISRQQGLYEKDKHICGKFSNEALLAANDLFLRLEYSRGGESYNENSRTT